MNDCFFHGDYISVESVTRKDDESITDCTITFNGLSETIPFWHHEYRDVTDVRTVFAFLANQAMAYELWPTAEAYYKGMYPINYRDGDPLCEEIVREHAMNREACEKLHNLFGNAGFELFCLMADDI